MNVILDEKLVKRNARIGQVVTISSLAILGAGMAGFGATSKLNEFGIAPVVYEKQSYIGGHAASFASNGLELSSA